MRNILVTGGAGFIGANFVHYWNARYKNSLIVLDALSYAGNLASLTDLLESGSVTFIYGDICDEALLRRLFEEHSIDTVVHFAAESHVDRSIQGPDPFIHTNILGTHTLLKVANEYWEKRPSVPNRFHHVSTDEVYGSLDPDDPAFTEITAYDPRSPYSASKAASDHLVRAYHHTYGLNVTISNCSNNYGPYHFPEKLIPLTILNILHGREIPVYGDGRNIRDWLYVEDHCRALDLVLHRGVTGETYNIGGRCERANIDVVTMLCGIVDTLFSTSKALGDDYPRCPAARGDNCTGLIHYVTDRPGHDRRYAIDINKIRTELGFIPGHDFESGLEKTVRWYLDHPDWWRPLLNDSYRDWLELQYRAGYN